jgi:hypothetical protein
MKRALTLGLLSLFGCGSEERPAKSGGAVVHVLFDERHGLVGGEPVRFHDFEVGRVEKVDLAEARVRATLSIDPEVASQLTRESTFSVESDGSGTYLLAHVFDSEAEKLEEGGTLIGVDSSVELAMRQAAAEASRLLSRIGTSEWVQDAKEMVSEMERSVDEIDWGEKEKEVRDRLESARKGIEESDDYQALRKQMEELVEELRALGRSEQAKKLKEQIDKLFGAEPREN